MREYERLNGVFPIPFKICEGLSGQEACEFEKALISFYGRQDINTGCLFNLTDGGEGTNGHIVTAETKAKQSASRMGWKPSPETIAKRLASMTGYVVSDETREKMRLAQTGRKQTPETKAKISAIVRARGPVSVLTRAKMSASIKGKPRGRGKGFTMSEETKAKISAALKEIRKTIPPANKGKKESPEICARNALSRRGKVPWNKGIPLPLEIRIKISETLKEKANKGCLFSEKHRKNISVAQKCRYARERIRMAA